MALLIFLTVLLFLSYDQTEAQLQVGFYRNSCPQVEFIIWDEMVRSFLLDKRIAPGILRLSFHDCFVRGCDASLLIDSTPQNAAEKDGPPNSNTLRGFEVIDRAKARVEAVCKGVVSCADILAFAARDSVVVTGGLGWDVPAGRRDGRISCAEETIHLPSQFGNLDQITADFAKKGLSRDEMIALQGAHTIGGTHCTSFSDRLYNFSSTNAQDPSLSPHFAIGIKLECPRNPQGTVNPNLVAQMNFSPFLFENSYYRDILTHRVLFTSDQTLITTPDSLDEVIEYANNNRKWQEDFVQAMIKMSQIEVLTGTAGEIRANCRVLNPTHVP